MNLENVFRKQRRQRRELEIEAEAEIENLPSLRRANCTDIYEFKN